jgi:hypothetical protein
MRFSLFEFFIYSVSVFRITELIKGRAPSIVDNRFQIIGQSWLVILSFAVVMGIL